MMSNTSFTELVKEVDTMTETAYKRLYHQATGDNLFIPIITSLLDCDMYKFSMLRMFFYRFSNLNARYEFKCRTNIKWPREVVDEIRKQVDNLCTLQFTEDEIKYLSNIYYMKEAKGFLEFLRMFQLNRRYIEIMYSGDGNLIIQAEGPIWAVSMFEIYVLAIVNETYFQWRTFKACSTERYVPEDILITGKEILKYGIDDFNNSPIQITFSDFGTRRRYSKKWQEYVIGECYKAYEESEGIYHNLVFSGTSNVMFAKQFGITPIGTMAHEYIMLGQALDCVTIANSQQYMLQQWAEEYEGDLGIALSDTLGIDYFLKHDFNKYYAKLFDGVRHDSGDPINFGEKIIKHYNKLGMDPTTKTIVFSDGLDFEKALIINNWFDERIKTAFGIGTKLTNDFGHWFEPLNIVYKLTEVNGKPVAKLSDSPGKGMCKDEKYLSYLKSVIDYKEPENG